MAARDTLVTEVASAFVIVGLLLVFLPLFLEAVGRGKGGRVSWTQLQWLKMRAWLVTVAVAVGATDATTGLLTLWGTFKLAEVTAILLVVLVWTTVGLAALATNGG